MTRGGKHRAAELPTPRRPPPTEATTATPATDPPRPRGDHPQRARDRHHPSAPAGSTDVGSRVLSERELSRRIPWFSAELAPNGRAGPGRARVSR
jgi:hypothetical protein